MQTDLLLTSLKNARVKEVIRLRKRSHRDKAGLFIVEGYRELLRAVDNDGQAVTLFYCPELFQGENEQALIDRCRQRGCECLRCMDTVFQKMAYRDRPEGLLALFPQNRRGLADLTLPEHPLVLIAESVEKPGNLGTILRTADAAGADAVVVCDRCTDVFNPNVVRASIGTLFCVPVAECSSEEALAFCKERGIKVLAATPYAETVHTDVDMTGGTAIAVGSEQYGLKPLFMEQADLKVLIPMRGQVDSLNVSASATILLYEALRQRSVPTT